ncbi:MAG: hypothetical protein ACREC4_06025, partial [Methylocella sp.]
MSLKRILAALTALLLSSVACGQGRPLRAATFSGVVTASGNNTLSNGVFYENALTLNSSSAAAANSIAINAAIQAACTAAAGTGAGFVYLPAGVIYVAAALDNNCSNVFVVGMGRNGSRFFPSNTNIDAGTQIFGTTANAILRHRTVYGTSSTQENTGGGFLNLSVWGNGIATDGLIIDTISGGTYSFDCMESVGTECVLTTAGTLGTNVASNSVGNQNMNMDVFCSQISTGAASSANCFNFAGSTTLNTSYSAMRLTGQFGSGIFAQFTDADNNTITSIQGISTAGSPRLILMK